MVAVPCVVAVIAPVDALAFNWTPAPNVPTVKAAAPLTTIPCPVEPAKLASTKLTESAAVPTVLSSTLPIPVSSVITAPPVALVKLIVATFVVPVSTPEPAVMDIPTPVFVKLYVVLEFCTPIIVCTPLLPETVTVLTALLFEISSVAAPSFVMPMR